MGFVWRWVFRVLIVIVGLVVVAGGVTTLAPQTARTLLEKAQRA